MRKRYQISYGSHTLKLGHKTSIMGVLNVTPDSFSDGDKFYACEDAVAHGEKLAKDGADIIDIGGESTRPFSEPVPAEEEIRRVVPVIEKLSKRISIPISVDTAKAEVAKAAIEAGASIINDIQAMRLDNDMANVAAEYGVPVILMHMRGTPQTMQIAPSYDDLLNEIKKFLSDAIENAVKKGIERSNIIVDPGIGFGKTVEHNLQIINQLDELKSLDVPVLIGPSRKSFIQKIFKVNFKKSTANNFQTVEAGTQAAVAVSVLKGAHIVRVHDVAATSVTVKMVDAIMKGKHI